MIKRLFLCICFIYISCMGVSKDIEQSSEHIPHCHVTKSSKNFGAKAEIESDRMFLHSKFEKIERLLHDFVLCLASQSNKDVCLYDYQIPSSKESMIIREKYENKLENLKQEMTKTIVNNSVNEIVHAQNLKAKLKFVKFRHKCQIKLYESRQSELTERLKKLENLLSTNNTALPRKLDSDTSGHEKPCSNVTEPRAKVLMMERIITEKDKFISKLQDNLENLFAIVLKQRRMLLLSTELGKIQRVLLGLCSSKLKHVPISTLMHTESFATTHRLEIDQTIGTFPITNSKILPETKYGEEAPKTRTHFYHLESTFCSRNGQKYTYQSEPEGPQSLKKSRMKSSWLASANHRYLGVPHTLDTNESLTVWAKVHSDDDLFYFLELKPRNI